MKIRRLILINFILHSWIIFGAADSSSSTTVQVAYAGGTLLLERTILLKMPYFRAYFHPALYMRAIPAYTKYIDTFKDAFAMNISPDIRLPEGTNREDFMFLYNELARIPNERGISIDSVIKELTKSDYVSPGRIKSILNLAEKLLTVPSVLSVLDELWAAKMTQKLSSPNSTIAKAFFAPQENLLETLLGLIKSEKSSIRIACYRMTHPEIICELARAVQRNVNVTVLVDNRDTPYEDITKMHDAGLRFNLWQRRWFDTNPKMHNKFFIFGRNVADQALLVTGSANCTWSAQEINEENIVVVNDPTMITKFSKQFDHLRFFSKSFTPLSADDAYAYIASCLQLDQPSLMRFSPHAPILFEALVRLYAEYILSGLVHPFGITSRETEQKISTQIKELSKTTGAL